MKKDAKLGTIYPKSLDALRMMLKKSNARQHTPKLSIVWTQACQTKSINIEQMIDKQIHMQVS